MKKWIVFLLGFLTGIVVTFIFILIMSSRQGTFGITFYEEPSETIYIPSVTVFQALSKHTALVNESGKDGVQDQIYLLYQKDNAKAFYDGQVVRSAPGKQFKVVGVYSYTTGGGYSRTVPVISQW